MKQITVYSIKELEDEVRERAISDYKSVIDETFWDGASEIFDSYKACLDSLGVDLVNYSLGVYDRGTFAKLDINDNIKELAGARAFAWLENNFLKDLRITRAEYLKNRKNYFKYGSDYRIGHVKPCALTGVCYDEAFIESLIKEIKEGSTLEDAFNNLLYVCIKLLENESDYRSSEEYIIEELEANDYQFTEKGMRL